MFKWFGTIYSLGAPDTCGIFSETGELFQSRLQEVLKTGKEKYGKYMLSSCCTVSLALMIILSKGVKGFLIKQKAIYKQITFLKCKNTANSIEL